MSVSIIYNLYTLGGVVVECGFGRDLQHRSRSQEQPLHESLGINNQKACQSIGRSRYFQNSLLAYPHRLQEQIGRCGRRGVHLLVGVLQV